MPRESMAGTVPVRSAPRNSSAGSVGGSDGFLQCGHQFFDHRLGRGEGIGVGAQIVDLRAPDIAPGVPLIDSESDAIPARNGIRALAGVVRIDGDVNLG